MFTNHPLAAKKIRDLQDVLADRIVTYQYELQPESWKPLGDLGRVKSVRDAGYHLTYLAEALEAGEPTLFTDYLAWVKVLFNGLKFGDDVLPVTMACTRRVLTETLDPELHTEILSFLDTALETYREAPSTLESFIGPDNPLSDLARRFINALLRGDRRSASEMILENIKAGTAVQDVYLDVFQRSQREIGRLWQTNQISVAQEHYCTAATQMIISQLYPYIFASEKKGKRMVTTCVGGELHEIGARMVTDFFEMDGWDTYFLGANTPIGSVLDTVVERGANLLAISATMTFHVGKVKEMIQQLRQSEQTKTTKVLVGGYPFNIAPDLWQSVGADGYASDAKHALGIAERLMI